MKDRAQQIDPANKDSGHHMITRSKSGIFKPKIYSAESFNEEPSSYYQAIQDEKWKTAMKEEYDALTRNKTWPLVQLPEHKNVIGCKWTYRLKKNPDGTILKYKARLVAKGYSQHSGFDFTETFSPVVKPSTIRIVLTIVLHKGTSSN